MLYLLQRVETSLYPLVLTVKFAGNQIHRTQDRDDVGQKSASHLLWEGLVDCEAWWTNTQAVRTTRAIADQVESEFTVC